MWKKESKVAHMELIVRSSYATEDLGFSSGVWSFCKVSEENLVP